MSTVKTGATNSKRRRGSDRSGRRFEGKDSSKRNVSKKNQLPAPVTFSKKKRRGQGLFRLLVLVSIFFVLMSTISSWRTRFSKRRLWVNGMPAGTANLQHAQPVSGEEIAVAEESKPDERAHGNESASGQGTDDDNHNEHAEGKASSSDTSKSGTGSNSDFDADSSHDDGTLSLEDLPERIEWYTRDDFKDGSRPMCRISNLYLLSNGTILLPDWMSKYEKLLQRCGISAHSFFPAEGPEGLEKTIDIGTDFVLTIHPEKFQEPTNVPSVYLTEHILKASYLFDVFSGKARPVEGVREHHCYTTSNDSECSLPRPTRTLLKPAIFVPKKIETSPTDNWTRRLVDMFGMAHGIGNGAIHLNVSTILYPGHDGKADELIGTRFRSIMITDGMFRHLPEKALKHSSFYSMKNGISRAPKEKASGGSCQVNIGLASPDDINGGVDSVSDLKEKIEVLGKLAVPESEIETKLIEFKTRGGFDDHIKEMQDLDIYIGGSGDQMSSIGYLHSSSAVVELMPFGVKPNTHESLARALGVEYVSMTGKPQVDDFKRCIEGEVFGLRKKGKLAFTETPDWQEPLMKAWDDAVGEFVLSGKSSLDLLTAEEPVRNYHGKVCALRQKIEVGLDEVARKVALLVKERCTAT